MTEQQLCESPLTAKIRGLKNPKLIRSFASDPELEDALVKEAGRSGHSMSEIIRAALRSALLDRV